MPSSPRLVRCTALLSATLALQVAAPTESEAFRSTDIIVLGDSQLSFGAGPVFTKFFSNLPQSCAGVIKEPAARKRLSGLSYGMLGPRSTSLQSWVSTGTSAWKQLCRRDKRFGVNASSWGTMRVGKRRYVQVGTGPKFRFCRAGQTPLKAMFAGGYYKPDLLMFFIGGNGAGRLAGSPAKAKADVDRLVATLPKNVGCVFMLSVPIFTKRRNRTRLRAQQNLKAAFAAHGNRCTLVEGHTARTRAIVEGNPARFRRRKNGSVRDPWHPDQTATARFLNLRRTALCRALSAQLTR